MSLFPSRNLDPLLPREEIIEQMIRHADLILPRPWNQVEKGGFGELMIWEGASSGEGELRMMRRTELVRKREREI